MFGEASGQSLSHFLRGGRHVIETRQNNMHEIWPYSCSNDANFLRFHFNSVSTAYGHMGSRLSDRKKDIVSEERK